MPKLLLNKFVQFLLKLEGVEGEFKRRSWKWTKSPWKHEAKGVLQVDIKGVEAIDLDSGGEAKSISKLWTSAAIFVGCFGVCLRWCEFELVLRS